MSRNGLNHSDAGKLGALATKEFWTKQQEEAKSNYYKNPKICKECKTTISYEQRKTAKNFCSRSCSAQFNNRNRVKSYRCVVCSDAIKGDNKKHRKYCSNKCQKKNEWELRKDKIKSSGIAPYVTSAKRFLKDEYGHICQLCKNTEWMEKPIPLVLDHIDGHADNNSIKNLRLVCGNCDMQLPTYKGRNRGNGRFSRRQRRAEGKSF